jgi:hypothetical protein
VSLLAHISTRVKRTKAPHTLSQQFVHGVLRELSVCLCRYNAMLERGVAGFFVEAGGFALKHGLTRPTADVSDSD